MIIWSGWGILTVGLFFIGLLLGTQTFGREYGSDIGIIIAAVINFIIARIVNNPAKDRVVIDESTGERLQIKNRSSLFWIPMEWWSALMIIGEIVKLVTHVAK